MKKQLAAILLVLAISLSLLPAAAFAAGDNFQSTFFSGGSIDKPQHAPYMLYEYSEGGSDSIQIFYYVPEDIRKLGEAFDKLGGVGAFDEKYGTYCGYSLTIQVDGKLDNGSWQYKTSWDNDSGDDESMPYYLAARYYLDLSAGTHDFLESATQSWLIYISEDSFEQDSGWLAGGIISEKTEDGYTEYHYDMKNHTFSYRYRFIVSYVTEVDGESSHIISPWSDTVSIGKNGTQKVPQQLTNPPAPVLSQFSLVVNEEDGYNADYYLTVPDEYSDGVVYYSFNGQGFEPYSVIAEVKLGDGEWEEVYTANQSWLNSGYRSIGGDGTNIEKDTKIQIRVRILDNNTGKYSPYSNIIGTKPEYQTSKWAKEWIGKADELGLIPDCLVGQDLTKQITRAEFAAVCVKLYEALTNEKAVPAANPFTDCGDIDSALLTEVLKALNVGITDGTSDTTFEPNKILTREQAATMLTRVYKKVALEGWTLKTDSSFNTQFRAMFEMPELFADDAVISKWAKDSVYFMKAKGIIDGIDGNKFAPKHGTTAEESESYGLATREQALKIAVGMVTNLK